MCLTRVKAKLASADTLSGFGWKIFERTKVGDKEQLLGIYLPPHGAAYHRWANPYPVNRWLTAKRTTVGLAMRSYTSGFHIFATRRGARIYREGESFTLKKFVIRRVQFRGAHTIGIEYGEVMLIADQMKVLKK